MPIFRKCGDERSFAGTAFCVDGYLVTAGHVLNMVQTYYVRNGNDWHPLQHELWIPRQFPDTDKRGYDVALYPIPGLKSPLSFAEEDAEPLDELEVICWQWLPRHQRRQGIWHRHHGARPCRDRWHVASEAQPRAKHLLDLQGQPHPPLSSPLTHRKQQATAKSRDLAVACLRTL